MKKKELLKRIERLEQEVHQLKTFAFASSPCFHPPTCIPSPFQWDNTMLDSLSKFTIKVTSGSVDNTNDSPK